VFDAAHRLFVAHELGQQFVEAGLVFEIEYVEIAAKAVHDAVFRNGCFTCVRFSTTGFLCVPAIGQNLFQSCH
jgi:hypothetical protein